MSVGISTLTTRVARIGSPSRSLAKAAGLVHWVRAHYERAALVAGILFFAASSALIVLEILQFRANLKGPIMSLPVRPAIPPARIVAIKRAMEKLQRSPQWAFTGPSGLFVPEKHFVAPNGFPTTLRGTAMHPPVPNAWFEQYHLPIIEIGILQEDPDGDGFSNLEEWENHTSPIDQRSHPSFIAKLKLKSCGKEPFRLVFSSRVNETFAINTNDFSSPTQFLKLGDSIRGTEFKLNKFVEKYEANQYGTRIDVSELVLENGETGEFVSLVKERAMTSPELVANFVYSWGVGRNFSIRRGEEFSLKPEEQTKYRLIDVQSARALIINTMRPHEPIEIVSLNP